MVLLGLSLPIIVHAMLITLLALPLYILARRRAS
jgi:hypothetical protein